jgi:PAS domain S-box-containing protein
MRGPHKLSLRHKITIAIMVNTIAALCVTGIAFVGYGLQRFKLHQTEDLRALANVVGTNSTAALAFEDPDSATEILQALAAKPHILAACIYNPDGKPFAVYHNVALKGVFSPPPVENDTIRFTTERVVIFQKITLNGEKVGTMFLEGDTVELQQSFERYLLFFGLILVAVSSGAYITAERLQRPISTPILDLAWTAKMVTATGDFSIRAGKQSEDEVGVLIDGFNEMLVQIQTRDAELREAGESLEHRVEERTVELEQEVADRQRAQEALHESEERIRLLLNTTAEAICGADREGKCTFCNPAALRLLGYQCPEDLLGKHMHTLLHPKHADGTPYTPEDCNILASVRKGEGIHSDKEVFWRSDGTNFPVECWAYPIRKEGEIVGSVMTFVDITQRRQFEEGLRKSQERYRVLFDAIGDAVLVHGISEDLQPTHFLQTNDVACQRLGYSRDEFAGMSLRDIVAPDSIEQSMQAWKSVLRDGHILFESEQVAKDGRRIPTEMNVRLMEFDGHLATLSIARDITERKRVEAELVKAKDAAEAGSRAKSEFLANMSHEIRTPLNGVIGMIDLALETDLTAEQREYLETVKLSGDSLLTVINEILDFSKIEAGKIDIEEIDFNLRDCLEETLKTLAPRADEKGLELLCEVASDVPEMARGDSSRLRQVLINLIGNAIKFTREGEIALKVQTETRGGKDGIFHFTVSDTGIGIPPEKLEMIFDPFNQADASTTRKFGGTGLGLTISSRLIRMMGGEIWVNSEVGQGTQMHFTVRLKVADTKPIELGPVAPPKVLRQARVLLVDDNRTNLRILEGMLKRWEMKSTSVQSGEEALEQLSAAQKEGEPFVLILTDMHMPKMDGFALVEQIRQKPELSTAIIMMLTSAGHRGDAARCNELGVAAYLLKPIRQSELREAIARVLGAQQKKGAIPLITRYSLQDARDPATTLRVLVAEDNPVNQLLATRLLQKRGHSVVVARNGSEALAALENEIYDLVLMDVQMPQMDGLEAAAAIREKEKGSAKHQVIVALTAYAVKGDRERCLAAGMDDYLSKPIRPQELDEMLQKCLTRRMEAASTPETVGRAK